MSLVFHFTCLLSLLLTPIYKCYRYMTISSHPRWKAQLIETNILQSFHKPKAFCISNPSPLFALNDPSLELCEDNVDIVVNEIKSELGTIFGYDAASREVGITGELRFVELDGPTVVVSLHGRFWHATDTVMTRVENFFRQRIPEVIEVRLDVTKSTIVDDNRLNSDDIARSERKLF